MNFDYDKDSKERIPFEHYLGLYQKADPQEISARTLIPYDENKKVFTLRLLGTTYQISHPEYEVHHIEALTAPQDGHTAGKEEALTAPQHGHTTGKEEALTAPQHGHTAGKEEDTTGYYPLEFAANARILILRYMLEGNTVPPSGKFLTYKEMPWGEVYIKQFHGRCILRLAYGFGNKLQAFQDAMEKMGGFQVSFGDCAYEVEFLNGLTLRFILWEGDDEFPPSAQILFSDNFPVAFHIEDMAVTGDIVIGMMKELGKK